MRDQTAKRLTLWSGKLAPLRRIFISKVNMRRFTLERQYCRRGEASAAFGRKPQELNALPAERAGKEYIAFGNYDVDNGLTMLRCYFTADGDFIAVNCRRVARSRRCR